MCYLSDDLYIFMDAFDVHFDEQLLATLSWCMAFIGFMARHLDEDCME